MKLHILGISGTFMSALALLAREAGHEVTGCDVNAYSPVRELLEAHQIPWSEGYEVTQEALHADWIIVGNAVKRGMPVLEAILQAGKRYTSGPQWLAENILPHYRVIAVSGTHGKTTTTAMIAHILSYAGLEPGYLIGGVAANTNTSAHSGKGAWFVIEADEYDSAYFDKRPKLMHYRPEVAVLNNLEFDHADIYSDLAAIEQQFHYYLKTIPPQGLVLVPRDDLALQAVIARGVFSRLQDMALEQGACWWAQIQDAAGQRFKVWHEGHCVAEVNWPLIGRFNVENGLSAMAASFAAGVDPKTSALALASFQPVKRRLEVKAVCHGITLYDDFAHHPTAIAGTIEALKKSQRHRRIFVVLEFASYTMRTGVHLHRMAQALKGVEKVFILNPVSSELALEQINWLSTCVVLPSIATIIEGVVSEAVSGDAVLIMSNRGFDNIHQRIEEQLNACSHTS